MIRTMTASHQIISDDCRDARGDSDAAGEAVERVHRALADAMEGYPAGEHGVRFHLVLTIERPA